MSEQINEVVEAGTLWPKSSKDVYRIVSATCGCYLVCVFFLVVNEFDPPSVTSIATKCFALFTLVANVSVFFFYYTASLDGKFGRTFFDRLVLRVHIAAGIFELLAAVFYLLTSSTYAALAMGLVGLFFHVPTSYLLTPRVFGTRAIMWPAYLVCTGLHAYCAARLVLNPDDLRWVISTFLVLNIYVWVRIYYFLLRWMRLFGGSLYSASILIAGVTVFPFVFGSFAPILILLACLVFVGIYRLLSSPEEFEQLVKERPRDTFSPGLSEDPSAKTGSVVPAKVQ